MKPSHVALGALALACVAWPAACGDDGDSSGSNNPGQGGANSGGDGSGASVGGGGVACGDNVCDASESCSDCALDCGSCCGNGTCDANELCGTCASDCGTCRGPAIDVVRGPYLQRGSTEATVVRWRTSQPTATAVAYGLATDNLSQIVVAPELTTDHEVVMAGLLPDTKFHYAFGAPESDLLGGDADHFVVTPPPIGTAKPTRIWVLGDSGTANTNARNVRDAYFGFTGATPTDLWIMLGDNAYSDGTDTEYQEAVFEMYPTILRNSVLWSTLGNHDGHSADSGTQSGPYYEIFTLPTQAEAGGVASATEAYYAFDYGNIHFVCLDSYDSDTNPAGAMMTWLSNDLAANNQPWLVAFFHHPPYSKGSHDSDSEGGLIDMRTDALPILEQHGVDLVLSGHSHAYERSMYLHGHYGSSGTLTPAMILDSGDGTIGGDGAYVRAPASTDGAVYVVAGSSGQASGGSLNHPAMYISLNELGSLVLDVDGAALTATFVDDAGQSLDAFTIDKN